MSDDDRITRWLDRLWLAVAVGGTVAALLPMPGGDRFGFILGMAWASALWLMAEVRSTPPLKGPHMDAKTFFDTYPVYRTDDDRFASMAEEVDLAHTLQRDEGIPFIAATVIAGDRLQAKRTRAWVEQGLNAQQALGFVGSYARLDFTVGLVEDGLLDRDFLLDNLPGLWRGSDPDDTDPRFLALWVEARDRNGSVILDDPDRPLPIEADVFGDDWLVLYRGVLGPTASREGIAWTTDYAIAKQFSVTGGLRGVRSTSGRVLRAWANPNDALAYLTNRSESEVVIDPADLMDTEPTWP